MSDKKLLGYIKFCIPEVLLVVIILGAWPTYFVRTEAGFWEEMLNPLIWGKCWWEVIIDLEWANVLALIVPLIYLYCLRDMVKKKHPITNIWLHIVMSLMYIWLYPAFIILLAQILGLFAGVVAVGDMILTPSL
ncbi:MAG: hypothetical protein J6C56_04755 [Alistipes sp.]|nr:hypothetical protein [Alistipes sp.]